MMLTGAVILSACNASPTDAIGETEAIAVALQSEATPDLTATALCVEGSAQPVMLYYIFGTPTPSAVPADAIATPTPLAGDVASGEAIYHAVGSCSACHSVDGSRMVGPPLNGIGARFPAKNLTVSLTDYLRGVILNPDETIRPLSMPGIMPRTYAQSLTSIEIEDLIAYLLTLG
jgi:mono/diheme cytochrome c family protein